MKERRERHSGFDMTWGQFRQKIIAGRDYFLAKKDGEFHQRTRKTIAHRKK